MKLFIFLSMILLSFAGCNNSADLKSMEEECLKQGKKFIVKKKFNYRMGEHIEVGECR